MEPLAFGRPDFGLLPQLKFRRQPVLPASRANPRHKQPGPLLPIDVDYWLLNLDKVPTGLDLEKSE